LTNVTIEYVIMLPLLILQVILFPVTAGLLMNVWVSSRRTIALQEAANNLGSTMQQIYSELNQAAISATSVMQKSSSVPAFIENYPYTGTATLQAASGSALNSGKVLKITLTLETTGISVTTLVNLGKNVQWSPSTFESNSTNAGISAQKFANATIRLSFME
jgi:phage tail tape-measure protein